jgi:hypothetical protein
MLEEFEEGEQEGIRYLKGNKDLVIPKVCHKDCSEHMIHGSGTSSDEHSQLYPASLFVNKTLF